MLEKSSSIQYSVAEHYHRDAIDFAGRFDILWEIQTQKTGRIKSFVDLLMSCECVLKSHIFLSHLEDNPKDTYILIRSAGHQIAQLADKANFLEDRSDYEFLNERLNDFSVLIRYSLDAYEMFFPFLSEREEDKLNYSRTIGNNAWVLEVRQCLATLLDKSKSKFSGLVTSDICTIFAHEEEMRKFMESMHKPKRQKTRLVRA
jgi:hypothetical protein